jgi:hypothetical protein
MFYSLPTSFTSFTKNSKYFVQIISHVKQFFKVVSFSWIFSTFLLNFFQNIHKIYVLILSINIAENNAHLG